MIRIIDDLTQKKDFFKLSIEDQINQDIQDGKNSGKDSYKPDELMKKFTLLISALNSNDSLKFQIGRDGKSNDDVGIYKLTIILDSEKILGGSSGQENKKCIYVEIQTLFKKNCVIVKTSIDNLSLSVEFGDDLTHLTSAISSSSPYMSAEVDEQRKIVFRVANTLNNFESFLDPLIDTIDVITISALTVYKQLGECIKLEKFGKMAKNSKQIVREIENKIALYTIFKNNRGHPTKIKYSM